MDLSNFAPNAAVVAVLGALVYGVVTLIKPFFDNVMAPTAPLHDPLLRIFVFALALGCAVLLVGVPATGIAVLQLVGTGLAVALGSFGTYHVTTGGQPRTPPTVPGVAAMSVISSASS